MTAKDTTAKPLDVRAMNVADIRRALSADRDGEIDAIIVTPETEQAAHAIVDYCWHDAEVVLSVVATFKRAA